MIKLLLKHAIVDECINRFFRTVAGNFHHIMADPNKKYHHVIATHICISNCAYSFYGVKFYLHDDGTVDQYSFNYDTFIEHFYFKTKAEATRYKELTKKDVNYHNERLWIDKLGNNLYSLCVDKSHYKTISLNSDLFLIKIIQ